MNVNWDDEIPNICKNRKCSKPPTSSVPQASESPLASLVPGPIITMAWDAQNWGAWKTHRKMLHHWDKHGKKPWENGGLDVWQTHITIENHHVEWVNQLQIAIYHMDLSLMSHLRLPFSS